MGILYYLLGTHNGPSPTSCDGLDLEIGKSKSWGTSCAWVRLYVGEYGSFMLNILSTSCRMNPARVIKNLRVVGFQEPNSCHAAHTHIWSSILQTRLDEPLCWQVMEVSKYVLSQCCSLEELLKTSAPKMDPRCAQCSTLRENSFQNRQNIFLIPNFAIVLASVQQISADCPCFI